MTDTTELTFSVYDDIKLEPLADPMYRQVQSLVKGSGRPGDGYPSVFPTLAPIAGMTRLHTLDLAFETTLGDISTVADLPALRVLRLGRVTGDLTPIGQCEHLAALALQSTSLRDLALFTPLSASLEELTISGESLTDFSALSAFGRLRELHVYGSPVDALPLHGLTALRTLDVGMPNLTELYQQHGLWDHAADGQGVISGLVVVLGLAACLLHFYFSAAHNRPLRIVSRVGVLILMLSFGAAFGLTVMGRISLAIGRAEELLGLNRPLDQVEQIHPKVVTLISMIVVIGLLAIWKSRNKNAEAG